MKYFSVLILFVFAVMMSAACGSPIGSNSGVTSSNSTGNANGNSNGGWTKIEPTNGAGSNSPAATNSGAGSTPTPGIPDPANFNKPFKPGATPTPGIPDAANIRKQMQRNAESANAANSVMNANRPTAPPTMMNKKKQPGPMANKVN